MAVQIELFPRRLALETTAAGKRRAVMEWSGRRVIFDAEGGRLTNPVELVKGSKVLRTLDHWHMRDEFGVLMNCVTGIPFDELQKAVYGLPYDKYEFGRERNELKNDCFNIEYIFDTPFRATHNLIGTTRKRPIEIVVCGEEWYYRDEWGSGRKFSNKYVPMEKFTEPI